MMNGHGVNTFLLVNDQEEATFCKFHWESKLGVHGLVWDEALKVAGQDPDFHRRDMYDAIESGSYPQWELGIQTMKESEVDALDFDPLDATKSKLSSSSPSLLQF
jgi:catalase